MTSYAGRFAGKVAVVTGGAQGIGRTVALRIAREGGSLALVDRSPLVEEVRHEAEAAGAEAIAIIADLETFPAPPPRSVVRGSASAASTSWSTMSAARSGRSPMRSTRRLRSRRRSAARCSRRSSAAAPCCRECWNAALGSSSTCLPSRRAESTACLTRRRRAASTRSPRLSPMEYAAHGIRVCGVAPGGTEAPARRIPRNAAEPSAREREWYRQVMDQTISSSLMKRYGTTEEQAAAILFLASDEASYITGVTLPVAGGDLG